MRKPLLNVCILALSLIALRSSAQNQQSTTSKIGSITYAQTIRRLKDLTDNRNPDDEGLALLFADGDSLRKDFERACAEEDQPILGKAFELLALIGDPKAENCYARVERIPGIRLVGWADTFSSEDFSRFEKLLAPQACEASHACKGSSAPGASESFVYSLILDGSDRAKSLLSRLYEADEAAGMQPPFAPSLPEALSLFESAQNANEELGTNPEAKLILATSFYVPSQHRQNTGAKFIARSCDGNRMLFRVS